MNPFIRDYDDYDYYPLPEEEFADVDHDYYENWDDNYDYDFSTTLMPETTKPVDEYDEISTEMCASDAYINMIWPVFQAAAYRAVDPYSASEIMKILSNFITLLGRGFIDK